MNQLYPQAYIQVNQIDADLIGVSNDQYVRVSSRRGAIVLRVQVTEKATPGVVFIPFHFSEAAANLLTIDALDPKAKIPEFKACAVKINAVEEDELSEVIEPVKRGRY